MLYHITAYSGTFGRLLLKYKKAVFDGEQEKECIFSVRMGQKNPSLTVTICHHSASLVMPNGDPRDIFFCPILTLMIYLYYIKNMCTYQVKHGP